METAYLLRSKANSDRLFEPVRQIKDGVGVSKESVKRNFRRFPSDFMFQLTQIEWVNLKSQIVTSSWGGLRRTPFAFTEQGLAMLSGILNSDIAIEYNLSISNYQSQACDYTTDNCDCSSNCASHKIHIIATPYTLPLHGC